MSNYNTVSNAKDILEASSSTTSQSELFRLSKNYSPLVRLAVAKNEYTSKRILRIMSQDSNKKVRDAARQRLL